MSARYCLNYFKAKLGNSLNYLTPLGDLLTRLWVAKVFFDSGLTKIASWDSTVNLFTYKYSVPFLPPELAAYIGTGIELVMPVLLVIGLGGRLPAMVLFLFNIMCVLSYPVLLTANGAQGLYEHITWGLLLLVIILHGPGKLTLSFLTQFFPRIIKQQKMA